MAIIDKMEQQLRPAATDMKPYEAKFITLASGEKMVVRQIDRDQGPIALAAVEPLIQYERDFYDIVRLFEVLKGHQLELPCLVAAFYGLRRSEVIGLRWDAINFEKNTITIKQGLRIGAQLFAAKMEYHFDYLDQDEVWIVAESPNGFKRWMIEYELESRPEQWHELGGVPTYVLTRPLWEKPVWVLTGGGKARPAAVGLPVPAWPERPAQGCCSS